MPWWSIPSKIDHQYIYCCFWAFINCCLHSLLSLLKEWAIDALTSKTTRWISDPLSVVKYFSWNGFWNVNNYTGSFEISERDMYPIHALPTCIHALDVCVKDPSCLRLYGDFRDHCKTRTGSCRDRYVSNDHPSPTIFSFSSRKSIRV